MKTIHFSDEILISRVTQGDSRALEVLYDRHAAMVLGILVRMLGERTVAEEMLQETFWQVWQTATTYSPQIGPLTGWLFKIARNLAQAEIKAREEAGSQNE